MDYQNNSYEKTTHSFKGIKRIIHDTNKHLLYIRTCIQEDELQEAIQHLNKTLDNINVTYQRVTTGNLIIDALVSNAIDIAYNNCIAMKYNIHVIAADITIDGYDLCIVIGNVLDNAIEAAQLIPENEGKFIHLQLYTTNDTLVIHVVNSRSQSENQNQYTSKENPNFHKFGLTNIKKVADKYGGHLKIIAETKRFETIVVLPLAGE